MISQRITSVCRSLSAQHHCGAFNLRVLDSPRPRWCKIAPAGRNHKRAPTAATSCFSSSAPAEHQEPRVTTYRRQRIPTQTSVSHRVPLSIVDIHLRNEQLPFGYFFRETLDENKLEESLRLVLKDFPQTGGTFCYSHTAIQCHPDDAIDISFGRMNITLDEWEQEPRGHRHLSYHKNCVSSGHPKLLPIFDPLFNSENPRQDLMNIRITYFEGEGTAIGVNFLHALGDTSTAIHFVQSWGKQMRQKVYKKVGSDRSKACLSGMMTTDVADVMGLPIVQSTANFASIYDEYVPKFLRDYFATTSAYSSTEVDLQVKDVIKESFSVARPNVIPIPHEYVRLVFPAPLLERLKAMGTHSCSKDDGVLPSFVSTNDMLSSYGWLLKRHLSQRKDYNLSMVVNLRGRSGVHPVLFGNGISHVVATTKNADSSSQLDLTPDQIFVENLCLGAKSIRHALQTGLSDLPDALLASQMGRPHANPSNSTMSFSTTSWGKFPLYKIKFAESSCLSGFHGHPAYPLPEGKTFASVITPCPDGAYWYEMLLPSDQALDARVRHAEMTSTCMSWTGPTELQ